MPVPLPAGVTVTTAPAFGTATKSTAVAATSIARTCQKRMRGIRESGDVDMEEGSLR